METMSETLRESCGGDQRISQLRLGNGGSNQPHASDEGFCDTEEYIKVPTEEGQRLIEEVSDSPIFLWIVDLGPATERPAVRWLPPNREETDAGYWIRVKSLAKQQAKVIACRRRGADLGVRGDTSVRKNVARTSSTSALGHGGGAAVPGAQVL